MHLCGMDYKSFSPHCCKCNSFGCIAAIRGGNACRGPHSDSLYSGSERSQFYSPRLVKREAGFPNPRRALIGSNQLWRVNDHTTENGGLSEYSSLLQDEPKAYRSHIQVIYVVVTCLVLWLPNNWHMPHGCDTRVTDISRPWRRWWCHNGDRDRWLPHVSLRCS